MAEQPIPIGSRRSPDSTDLHVELAQRDQEILRLRDLLMTRDQELGELKGRIAMIDQASRSLGDAVARIPIPGATRVLQALIRFVQRATT
ncbi:MAG: hypothetical protein JST53_18275 [Actinobacteria bacterium]|nr:hypothetical protein [Actinomycetota bacterium]